MQVDNIGHTANARVQCAAEEPVHWCCHRVEKDYHRHYRPSSTRVTCPKFSHPSQIQIPFLMQSTVTYSIPLNNAR